MSASNWTASVIVNNYNYGRFLAEAVGSALAQTYTPCEVIVVDDGSTDNSREVLQAFGSRIKTVFQENLGQASAYTSGFQACRGDVVIFLDADDVLESGAMQHAVDVFLSDPAAVKVQWYMREIDEQSRQTGNLVPGYEISEGDLRESVLRTGPIGYASAPASGNAWRRTFLQQVMPVESLGDRHGADSYLFTLTPLYGAIRNLSHPHGAYRRHGGNSIPASLAARMARELRRNGRQCEVARKHLARQGVVVPEGAWRGPGSTFEWLQKMVAFPERVASLLPAGTRFILCDEGQIGCDYVPDRIALPFPERDGEYAGPIVDEASAIADLERLRGLGAEYFVVVWTASWILDSYPGLADHLNRHYGPAIETDVARIYRLEARAS